MNKIPRAVLVALIACITLSVPSFSGMSGEDDANNYPIGTWWTYRNQNGDEMLLVITAAEANKLLIHQYQTNQHTRSFVIHFDSSGIYLRETAVEETTIRWIPALRLSPNGPMTTQRTHQYEFLDRELSNTQVIFYTHQTAGEATISVPFSSQFLTRRVESTTRSGTKTTRTTLWFSEDVGLVRLEMSVVLDGVLHDYVLLELVDHGRPEDSLLLSK